MNSAAPVWIEMEGNAVIVAEQEIDGNFQWAWSANDAVWIVRGTRDAEDYVRGLLRLHAASLDPYDQQGMTGDLFDHTSTVPGFQYWDPTHPVRTGAHHGLTSCPGLVTDAGSALVAASGLARPSSASPSGLYRSRS
jgi:hypothetical protein